MSGLIKRQQARDSVMNEAIGDTWKQFMIDMVCLTLNDPEIMNKDVFGYDRLMVVCNGVLKKCDQYKNALTKHEDADYLRDTMDKEMLRIAKHPSRVIPFETRYPWIYKIIYGKKKLF